MLKNVRQSVKPSATMSRTVEGGTATHGYAHGPTPCAGLNRSSITRLAGALLATSAVFLFSASHAQADWLSSCGTGCVDYGGTKDPGGYAYARRSDGSRMQADWDANHRDQNFYGCLGIETTGGSDYVPRHCGVGSVWSCAFYPNCSAGQTGVTNLWVWTSNNDNSAHNITARAWA
jgi:hypothetical protein